MSAYNTLYTSFPGKDLHFYAAKSIGGPEKDRLNLSLETKSKGKSIIEKMKKPTRVRGPRLILTYWAAFLVLGVANVAAHTGKYHPEEYRDVPIPNSRCDTISVSYAEGQGRTTALVEVRSLASHRQS